jgi:hypothetical protein
VEDHAWYRPGSGSILNPIFSTRDPDTGEFPDQGGAIKEALRKTIRETLGDNRYFLFSKISRGSLGYAFLDYGETDVHITMKRSGPPGPRHYETMVFTERRTHRFETEGVPPAFEYLLKVE